MHNQRGCIIQVISDVLVCNLKIKLEAWTCLFDAHHVCHLFSCFQSTNGKFTQPLIKHSMFDLNRATNANITHDSWLHLYPLFISLYYTNHNSSAHDCSKTRTMIINDNRCLNVFHYKLPYNFIKRKNRNRPKCLIWRIYFSDIWNQEHNRLMTIF